MVKLKDEMILPTKLREMCAGAGGCWFGSLPGEELRKAVRYVGKGKKYNLYFCFGLIEGDWIFKSFILKDKKKTELSPHVYPATFR
jgi:hypothetical protein